MKITPVALLVIALYRENHYQINFTKAERNLSKIRTWSLLKKFTPGALLVYQKNNISHEKHYENINLGMAEDYTEELGEIPF